MAAGMMREVEFEPVSGSINDRIDEACRTKYRSSPYLKPMSGTTARSATVRIIPRRVHEGSSPEEIDQRTLPNPWGTPKTTEVPGVQV